MKKLFVFLIIIFTIVNTAYATEFDEEFAIAQKIVGKDGLNIVDIAEDDVITRADMVDIIIEFMRIYENTYYIRDPQEHIIYMPLKDWELNEEKELFVEHLYEIKVIRGCDDNTFRPNDVCTYEEAITFIVRALGWGDVAEYTKGGYPQGYIDIALKLGLISYDNVNLENSNEIIKMIYKSLFANTLELDMSKYPKDLYFLTTPCPLEKYLGLNYTYGYATKEEAGLTIDDEFFVGEVFENEEFKQGYVMCIYDTDEESNEKRIVICLEISKDYYDSKTSD